MPVGDRAVAAKDLYNTIKNKLGYGNKVPDQSGRPLTKPKGEDHPKPRGYTGGGKLDTRPYKGGALNIPIGRPYVDKHMHGNNNYPGSK